LLDNLIQKKRAKVTLATIHSVAKCGDSLADETLPNVGHVAKGLFVTPMIQALSKLQIKRLPFDPPDLFKSFYETHVTFLAEKLVTLILNACIH
jgi:hypothetical protein